MPTDFMPLGEPLRDGGIRTVNFFNGRLLTGGDLGREQQARREADARIGLCIGDGVARGLEVAFKGNIGPGGTPAAEVTTGIAVNREGRTLSLPATITLALARGATTTAADTVACLFGDCAPLAPGDYVAGAGLYMLTIAPAFASEGRAAVSGMASINPACAIDATVEGVQFRLLRIDPARYVGIAFGASDFRNRIAYRAFGDGVTATWASDLYAAAPRRDDLVEDLRAYGLSDDEVPLALLAFDANGHVFTDMWSVRRPVALTDGAEIVANLSDPRRLGLGRAMFRQFQAQVAGMADAGGGLGAATARAVFRRLPPAGLIPRIDDAAVTRFFAGMTVRGPLHIDAHAVEPLIRESFAMPAIDTASEEVVWLYRIAQTRIAKKTDMLLFACGHLPARAEARFDLNYWDFANYALIR